jgi:hypothetical protein
MALVLADARNPKTFSLGLVFRPPLRERLSTDLLEHLDQLAKLPTLFLRIGGEDGVFHALIGMIQG